MPLKTTLIYWPLLLIAACIIFFILDSLLLYNDQSSQQLRASNNMYVIINNNDHDTIEIKNPNNINDAIHGTEPIEPRPNAIRRRMILDNLTFALRRENRKITLIINSCGRLDLLRKTISSFLLYYPHNKYPLFEKIIIDDSRNTSIAHRLIDEYYPEFEIIMTANNAFEKEYKHRDERITFAMDKIYNQVVTPWIYHIEDDWIFNRNGWIEESFDIFEASIPYKYQTGYNWSNAFGEKGLMNTFPNRYRKAEGNDNVLDHFFYDPKTIYSVVLCWNMYRQKVWCNRTYLYEYKESQWYNMNYHLKRGVTWGGFSFNAGLQPTFIYKMYGTFFSSKGESGKSEQMIKDGLKVALMAPPACDHIGRGRHIDSGELVKP